MRKPPRFEGNPAGDTDLSVLDDLVRLCVQLDRLEHGVDHPADHSRTGFPAPASPPADTLQQAIIGKTIILLLHSEQIPDLRLL